jgi:hypothetical protein
MAHVSIPEIPLAERKTFSLGVDGVVRLNPVQFNGQWPASANQGGVAWLREKRSMSCSGCRAWTSPLPG